MATTADAASATATSIAKQLASCNPRTRNEAVRLLPTLLPSLPSVSDDDMRKIWKGLFYTIWHSDKPLPQLRLLRRLSSLLLSLPTPLSLLFFSSFLSTLRREWSGIDSLRLDKFYLLLRLFLHHLFLLLRRSSWDPSLSSQFLSLLSAGSLLSPDGFPAHAVNYHFASIFWDELRDLLPLSRDTLHLLLSPFFEAVQRSPDKVLAAKIRSGVFDPLLLSGRSLLKGDADAEKLGAISVSMGFSARLFELASSPDTVQANRKVLFPLHEAFLKLEKDFERSSVAVSLPDVSPDDPVEVPEFEDSNGLGGEGENSNNKSKKKKKKKKARTMPDAGHDESNDEESNGTLEPESVATESDALSRENENGGDENGVTFDPSLMSNLQKQFEQVAAEAGMEEATVNLCGLDATLASAAASSKKRKRSKSNDAQYDKGPNGEGVVGDSGTAKSTDKSGKRVKFSMKSNLVWKPHNPLPPQSLRLPPSATPRGSALKKGIPPGPIREAALVKKVKHKKAKKGIKKVSSAFKRLRKLQSLPVKAG